MDIVEELDSPDISVASACRALGLSRATVYRHTQPSPPPPLREPRRVPRKLTDGERQLVLETLHTPEFADQPPTEVYATLLSQGTYVASIRTMYRILAEQDETADRRRQRAPQTYAKPSLTALALNQVWTWDITKLRTIDRGVFLCLYVIMDLFSRYVVGWLLAAREHKTLAKQLFADTLAKHGIEPGQLVVHADRGGPMKSDTLANLLDLLGVSRSFSRPHVSDDNPFSESQFKTLKYQPDYPDAFTGPDHARGWCQQFFTWHNDHHHHTGLALFTPSDVFHGRVAAVAQRRQQALATAFAKHPERFPNGSPRVPLPPSVVSINPDPTATAPGGSGFVPHSSPCDLAGPGRDDARHGVESCTSNPNSLPKTAAAPPNTIVSSLSTPRPSQILSATPS